MRTSITLLLYLLALVVSSHLDAQTPYLPGYPRPLESSSLAGDTTPDVVAADFNGDNRTDLMYANWKKGGQLFLNEGNRFFRQSPLPTMVGMDLCLAVDMDTDGDLDIFCRYTDQSVSKRRLGFLVNDGKGAMTLIPVSLSPTYGISRVFAFADIDRDGDQDLVMGNDSNTQNRLYLNDGRGFFTEATQGRLPYRNDDTVCLCFADVDRDGDPDLVTGNWDQIRLAINDGTGRFADATASRLPFMKEPSIIKMGDLNGDGYPDMVVGRFGGANQYQLNDGKGSYTTPAKWFLPYVYCVPYDLALGDIDKDGDVDVLIGSYYNANRLYTNDGKGVFTDVTATATPNISDYTMAVAMADLTGDGAPEIITANRPEEFTRPHSGYNHLYLNDGRGMYSEMAFRLNSRTNGWLEPKNTQTNALLLIDLDGDGDLDLLEGNDCGHPNRFLSNDGKGTFSDQSRGVLPPDTDNTVDMALADLDGDGRKDLVLANWGQNRLYLQTSPGRFTDYTLQALPTGNTNSVSVAVGDLDGDKDLDLVIGNHGQNQVLLNDGKGKFTDTTWKALPPVTENTNKVALFDADRDGDLDLIELNTSNNSAVYLNDGKGVFKNGTAAVISGGLPSLGNDLVQGDFNGDGHQDFVIARWSGVIYNVKNNDDDRLYLYSPTTGKHMNSGKVAGISWIAESHSKCIKTLDADGDGDLDLLVGKMVSSYYRSPDTGGGIYLLQNDGKGNFTAISATPDFEHTRALAVGDLDGDGDLDFISGNRSDGTTGLANRIHFNLLRHVHVPDYVRVGSNFKVDTYSWTPLQSPLFNAVLFIGGQGQPLAIPPFGTLWLDPAMLMALPLFTIHPAQGVTTTTLTVPNLPVLSGQKLNFQAVVEGRTPTGPIFRFTNLATETVF